MVNGDSYVNPAYADFIRRYGDAQHTAAEAERTRLPLYGSLLGGGGSDNLPIDPKLLLGPIGGYYDPWSKVYANADQYARMTAEGDPLAPFFSAVTGDRNPLNWGDVGPLPTNYPDYENIMRWVGGGNWAQPLETGPIGGGLLAADRGRTDIGGDRSYISTRDAGGGRAGSVIDRGRTEPRRDGGGPIISGGARGGGIITNVEGLDDRGFLGSYWERILDSLTRGVNTETTGPTFGGKSLEEFLNFIIPMLGGDFAGNLNAGGNLNIGLESFYGKAKPENIYSNLLSDLYGGGGGLGRGPLANLIGGGLGAAGNFLPRLMSNVDYLNQYGLPGAQQLEEELAGLGLGGGAGGLLGSLAGGRGYGVADLLSQIMSRGLPGQRDIEGLIPGQSAVGGREQAGAIGSLNSLVSGFGGGLEGDVESRLRAAMAGGGLTPEYVAATRRTVLDPSMAALRGRLNRQGGGVALPESGLSQELQRRQEQAFNDALIREGYGNYGNLLSQAQGLQAQKFGQRFDVAGARERIGADALNRSLGAFGGVAGAAYPYVGLGADLGTNLLSQSLNRFQAGAGLGLENLRTIGQLGTLPFQLAQGQQGENFNRQMQILQTILGGAGGLLGQQQQFGLGKADLSMSLLRSFLSGEQQKSLAQAQISQGNKGLIGAGIGSAGAIISALIIA